MTKHYWLYVLRLEQDKYYVGQTSGKDPNRRIQQHMDGFYSAQWVKKYKPIEVAETIDIGITTEAEASDLENHRTLQYMHKYGLQNVRGGKFSYSGKYVKIGDRYWRGEMFKTLMTITLLLTALLALVLKKGW